MGISSWAKKRLQTWLEIVPPPAEQAIVIQREHTREMEVIRSQLWYNGDANELSQFFHQTETNTGSFWGTAPQNSKIRQNQQLLMLNHSMQQNPSLTPSLQQKQSVRLPSP